MAAGRNLKLLACFRGLDWGFSDRNGSHRPSAHPGHPPCDPGSLLVRQPGRPITMTDCRALREAVHSGVSRRFVGVTAVFLHPRSHEMRLTSRYTLHDIDAAKILHTYRLVDRDVTPPPTSPSPSSAAGVPSREYLTVAPASHTSNTVTRSTKTCLASRRERGCNQGDLGM